MKSGVIGNKSKTGKGELSEDQVREIRASLDLYREAMERHSPMAISKRTGISIYKIRDINNFKTYNWVI